jgi:hypothetical protein
MLFSPLFEVTVRTHVPGGFFGAMELFMRMLGVAQSGIEAVRI